MENTRRKPLSHRLAGHATLVVLSLVFILPFVWLVATSLKPEDDIMEEPTSLAVLVPKGRFAVLEGERQRVTVAKTSIDYPARIVRWDEGPDEGKTKLVRNSEVEDGKLKKWLNAETNPTLHWYRVSTVKEVPASEDAPWKRIEAIHQKDEEPLWDCVPESELHTGLDPHWSNYTDGVQKRNFGRFYLNTALITIARVFLTVLSCSLVAYGFAVLEWRGRDTIFFLMLCTMMLPAQVTLIPVFMMFKSLGWINTYRPLVAPCLFGTPFFIFMLRQFYRTLPRSLFEAARIDGCGDLRIWWQLVMPLSKLALMTVGLFSFLGSWNDFMGPLVYLTGEKKYTLSVGLAMFQGEYGSQYGMLMAMTVLTIVPILVAFFFAQKTFIQGAKLSGTKG